MLKRRIDIIRQHQKAIDDLVQIGVLDAHVLVMADVYTARRVLGMKEKQAAKVFKCSRSTITKRINFLETEI